MKRILFVVLMAGCIICCNAQNVGIGTTTPLAPLHIYNDTSTEILRIQSPKPLISFYDNSSNYLGYLWKDGSNNMVFGTTAANNANIKLQLQGAEAFTLAPGGIASLYGSSSQLQVYQNGTFSGYLYGSGYDFYLNASTTSNLVNSQSTPGNIILQGVSGGAFNRTSGNVGIGTIVPATKLEVSGGDVTVDNDNSYFIANSTVTNNYCGVAMRVLGSSKAWMYWDNTNGVLNLNTATNGIRNDFTINSSGNVGIGTNSVAAADKLTVSNGYLREEGANPFFYTNAINAGENGGLSMRVLNNPKSWIYWDDANSVMRLSANPSGAGNNDLILNGVTGYIGIGTNSPQCPLDVESYVGYSPLASWHSYDNGYSTPIESIYSYGDVVAQAFVAFSDARVKNIEDTSNSADDLTTLNAIKITDYTMKDKMMWGNKHYKKIVAQQVEQVYPQVVDRIRNFIPNVCQFTSNIEKTRDGYLLTFKTPHHLDKDAKKLQLTEDHGKQQRVEIIAVPSDNKVEIKAPGLTSDTVFVYGEEVNDFRTVDYDGLTTLNISATQELSKLLQQQQEEINQLKEEIAELQKSISKNDGNH